MRTRRLDVVLAMVLLAGCAAPAGQLPAPPTMDVAPAPAGYAYACPPGETFERAPGVCAGTLEDRENGLDEPWLAIDPAAPSRMVLVAHSTPTTGVLATEDSPGVQTLMTAAYFTEDGGATWRRSELPRVDVPSTFGPVEARLYYDPAAAFGPDGRVHYGGIASNDLGAAGGGNWGAGNVPYWTASDDFGASWRDPVVLDERFSDRTFLAVEPDGRIVVAWYVYDDGGDVALAWSDDGGETWETLLSTGCKGFSPPTVAADGRAHLACVRGDARMPSDARLLRLGDDGLEEVAAIGELPGYRARLGVLPGGGFAVANDAGASLHLTVSLDGGATWTEPFDPRDAMTLDDAHPQAFLKWFDADPWGGVHLVVGLSDNFACSGGSRGPPGTCRVVHAAFDPATGTLRHEAVLSDADGAEAYRAPGSLAPPAETGLGDDFYTFDFAADHGVLVWTRDGGVDYTRLERAE